MDDRRVTRRSILASVVAGAGLMSIRGVYARADSALGLGMGLATEKSVRLDPPAAERSWAMSSIGASVEGRKIERWDLQPLFPRRHVAVICGMHGDERSAFDLASRFSHIQVPEDMHLTIIPQLNPDGWAAGTRRNANDVDLNRNFRWGWGTGTLFAGSEPLSEPETQAIVQFLSIKRPDLVIWVHQPLGYAAALEGCPAGYADLWSRLAGVISRSGIRQAGGGETWAALDLAVASMLIEVGGTRTEPERVDEHVLALETLLPFVQPMR